MSGEFDSRKDSNSTKLELRAQVFIKLSFRELCGLKLSGLHPFDEIAGSFHVKSPKKDFNPLSPNWLIFGTSVALHACMKLAKPFDPIQNGFGDMLY